MRYHVYSSFDDDYIRVACFNWTHLLFLEDALFICLSEQMKHEPPRRRSKICLVKTYFLQQNIFT